MVDAVRQAEADSGATGVARAAELVVVVAGAWNYPDPGRLIADDVSASGAKTALTTMGGQAPMAALGYLAEQIQSGQLGCAVLTGGETIWSRRRLRRQGIKMTVTEQTDSVPDVELGQPLTMTTPFEEQRNISQPIVAYPLFESAIRHKNGETIKQHRKRLGLLWAGFNAVAVDNAYAWSRRPMDADEIQQETEQNRMIGFPYTKAMNSNWDLDQASAIIVTSAEKAEALGAPRDNWIFPHATAEANDTASLSNRRDFHSSPAIAAAGKQLWETTEQDVADLSDIDLYSCFPSAVQIAAGELGLDLTRPLTVTGGLTFAGGPLNNYVGHSMAAMATTLRSRASGSVGLVTANGGFITKHALGLMGNTPADRPFRRLNAQSQADAIDIVHCDDGYAGPVSIEAYTVMHEKDGSRQGRCALRTPAGNRTWGLIDRDRSIDELLAAEAIGRSGNLDETGLLNLT